MDLREATHEKHKQAENTEFSKALVEGLLTEELYHQFLFNMLQVYAAIERRIPYLPSDVSRVSKFKDDLAALNRGSGTILPGTSAYIGYIESIDIPRVWAHVYVHYLGNMYGGQMIRKKLSWPSSHLSFDDVKSCITYVRGNVKDIDPAEANAAFDWTVRIYDELHRTFRRDGSQPQ